MKNPVLNIMGFIGLIGLCGCSINTNPSGWNGPKTDKWFEKGDWRNDWPVKPDHSINRAHFAEAYNKNRDRWNQAFSFLKRNDLANLEPKRYDLDGDNLYAMVSVYRTKNREDAKFEVHRKYIDIQYVVSGAEWIGIASLASQDSILQPYDATQDIEFLSVKQGKTVRATRDRFFIFFPDEAHMPGLKAETNAPVRKVVVKIRID